MENAELVVKTHECKTCKEAFLISVAHEKWYLEKGLKVPTHCPNCIESRKAANKLVAVATEA